MEEKEKKKEQKFLKNQFIVPDLMQKEVFSLKKTFELNNKSILSTVLPIIDQPKKISLEKILRQVSNKEDIVNNPTALKDFTDVFEFFEQSNYHSTFIRIENLDPDIIQYNCKRYNPLTKVLMIDEDIYVVNADSNEFSINFPQKFLEKAMDLKNKSKLVFISWKKNRVLKTSLIFLIYLTLNNERLDKIGMRQVTRLIKSIKKFSKRYREKYSLFLKLKHPKILNNFWNIVDNSFPDRLLRNEIYEYWEYGLKWRLKRMKSGYNAKKILELIKEWNKKNRRAARLASKKPDILDNELVLDIEDITTNMDKTLVDFKEIMNQREISLTSDGKLDSIIHNTEESMAEINTKIFGVYDEIVDDMEVNMYKNLKLYEIDKISKIRIVIKEFIKYQEDTDDLKLNIIDINDNVYELEFEDDNSDGQILLIDIANSKSYNSFPFANNTIRNLFDITGSNNFQIFFGDPRDKTFMKVSKEFIFQFIRNFDREFNIDKIDELNDLNREIDLIREYDKIPLIGVLDSFFSSIEIVLNHIDEYDLLESVTDEIEGIWKFDEEEEKYSQVYPSAQEEQDISSAEPKPYSGGTKK